jgi:hypothetical protein
MNVILSAAKNLSASDINTLRDSSSCAAPQNDGFGDFFSSLLVILCVAENASILAQILSPENAETSL